jgi:hypothetical protein
MRLPKLVMQIKVLKNRVDDQVEKRVKKEFKKVIVEFQFYQLDQLEVIYHRKES